jgi:hypothetical protein
MVDSLRKLTKKVQDAREKDDEGIVRDAIEQYDITMERYSFKQKFLSTF